MNWKENKLKSSNSPEVRMRRSREVIQAKRGKEVIRYLGVWISEKNRKECNESIIIKEVAQICKAILWKKATVSQLVYLNNSVLLPSIEYRLQTSFLSKNSYKRIQRPI